MLLAGHSVDVQRNIFVIVFIYSTIQTNSDQFAQYLGNVMC